MSKPYTTIPILLADDDEDDRLMVRQAMMETDLANDLHLVENGEQVMDYMYGRGAYAVPEASPRPGLILLDLNMPRKNGWEVLKELKGDPDFRRIPVVVFTTSTAEEDKGRCYELGANSYVVKPMTFEALVDVIQGLRNYWLQLVELPPSELN